MLGRKHHEFIRSYWKEVVLQTGAKVVIPIHWDNLAAPLDEGLKPTPYIADNVGRAMSRLLALARKDGVTVRLMPLFKPVDVLGEIK